MSVLATCLSVWYLWRPEEGIRDSGTEIICDLSHCVGTRTRTWFLWKSSWCF